MSWRQTPCNQPMVDVTLVSFKDWTPTQVAAKDGHACIHYGEGKRKYRYHEADGPGDLDGADEGNPCEDEAEQEAAGIPEKNGRGWKLERRKPAVAPAARQQIKAAPGCPKFTAIEKKAASAISVIPAARPSSPSIRLIAFVMPTSQTTVRNMLRPHGRLNMPPPGKRMSGIRSPAKQTASAMRSCPRSLYRARTGKVSSIRPRNASPRRRKSEPGVGVPASPVPRVSARQWLRSQSRQTKRLRFHPDGAKAPCAGFCHCTDQATRNGRRRLVRRW